MSALRLLTTVTALVGQLQSFKSPSAVFLKIQWQRVLPFIVRGGKGESREASGINDNEVSLLTIALEIDFILCHSFALGMNLRFGEEYANRKDLASFLGDFRKDLHGASFTDQSIDGGKNPQDPGTAGAEANLDIQYTVSLVNFAPVVFLSSGLNTINGFINVTNYWLNQDHPPTVVSISYGFLESVLGIKSAFVLCNLYAQLSSRGVSILVSSGDGGVAGSQPGECTDGKFRPDFPASCPFVTTVGATGGFHTEVAAKLSAGGFSDFFYQPNYQAAAVDGYLSQIGSLYHGLFNRTGRAYPDISAQGDDRKIVTIINQIKYPSGGTSASTPIVASIVTLLNDRLIKRGRPVLGFLNPWLYANQKALNNITSGSNPGCNTDGFPAKAGWNPVTGLGTPSFPRMAKAIRV
ncbi:hypothetical protein APHAL10511_005463 [Amanita phalloides]|nr:hypothetical protein APHAL10511_005463 [Amanita phalloides]